MRKITIITLLFFSLIFLLGCSSPELRCVNDLSALADELEQNSQFYTPSDWEDMAQAYEQIEEELAEYSQYYTPEQRREIGRYKARCHKAFIARFNLELKNESEELKGYMEEMGDIEDNIKWDEVSEDLENLFD